MAARLVEIRAGDLGTPRVAAFAREAWPDDPVQGSERWRARLESNPFLRSGEAVAFAIEEDGRYVAWTAATPVEIDRPGAASVRAAWIEDLVALPSSRGRGLGRTLVETARERHRNLLGIGMTVHARNLLLRLGWRPVGGGGFRRFLHHPVGAAPSSAWRADDAEGAARAWARCVEAGAVGTRRDARHHAWRFTGAGGGGAVHDDLGAVVRWRRRSLRGLPSLQATDLHAPTEAGRDEALRRLRREALRRCLPVVDVLLLDAAWDGALDRAGFRERRADSPALCVGPDLPPAEAAWHLAVADSDIVR